MKGHTGDVVECSFSNDRRLLATASYDCAVRLWDVDSHQCIATLKDHTNAVISCKFSPDDALVASASHDRTVRLWDVKSHRCIAIISGNTGVNSCAFSADGAVLASVSDDRTAHLWNMKTFTMIAILPGHSDYVYGCDVSRKLQTKASLILGQVLCCIYSIILLCGCYTLHVVDVRINLTLLFALVTILCSLLLMS